MSNEDLLAVQRRLQRQHGINPQAPAPNAAAAYEGMVAMVAANAEANLPRENEAIDSETGLLVCTICGGKRQTMLPAIPELNRPARTVRCWCQCPTPYGDLKQQEKLDEIDRNRGICFKNFSDFRGWTFEVADNRHPELMQAARGYAAQFDQYLKTGQGLLFYGDVGTGKSLTAACIANALIDTGYRPKMTSLAIEADNVWAAENKAAYIDSLCRYDLLILDDLGVERQTPYMQEMVYKIVNARLAQGGPVIVTTNLTKDEMGKPAEIGNQRIYSRLLQRCMTIKVEGADRRMEDGVANRKAMRQQLGIGGATT